MQDRMIEDHQEELGPLVGWKVGTTNRDMWPTFNLDEPTRAPLFNKYRVRPLAVVARLRAMCCAPIHSPAARPAARPLLQHAVFTSFSLLPDPN